MAAQHGAHASILTVAGYRVPVRRAFALICSVEERFGPLREFGERLEQCRFSARELADLYRIILADAEPRIPDDAIERHILDAGIMAVVTDIHPLVTAFFFGEERFMKRVAEQAGGPRPPGAEVYPPRPTKMAAPDGSTGANSSARPPG